MQVVPEMKKSDIMYARFNIWFDCLFLMLKTGSIPLCILLSPSTHTQTHQKGKQRKVSVEYSLSEKADIKKLFINQDVTQ